LRLGYLSSTSISGSTITIASVESCRRYYDNNKIKFLDKERDETLPFEMVEAYIKEYLLS
jgi:hypothetical protein